MNESGRAVGQALRFFKLSLNQIVIVHDDLDIVPGKVRVKTGGSAAGHNGLRSIDSHIGKEYLRIRLGVGHPGDKAMVTKYVLSDFAKDDQSWLDRVIPAVADAIPFILRGDEPGFTNKVSLLMNPRSEKLRPSARAAPADQD
jgi:PTH1 family peptidyl-tRNA hydrolase